MRISDWLGADRPQRPSVGPLSRWVLMAAFGSALAVHASVFAQDSAQVMALFRERCTLCHQGDAAPNGLRLDSFEAALKGGTRGPVIQPGNPGASELIRRLRGVSQPRMPLTGPPFLSDEQVALVERWIAAGAPPPPVAASPPSPPPAPAARAPNAAVTYADVQAILGARCAKCHTDNGLMGAPPEGYRLNTYASTLDAADRARVIPGQPSASELVRRIRGQSLPRMPFDGPPYLSPDEIALIERWIAQGARSADGQAAALPSGASVRLGGTLRGPDRLDDLSFAPPARVRGRAPAVGDPVELRGRVASDGRIVAERLRAAR